MVLDGNVNPTDYYHGLNEESVDSVDAALLHFFQTCVEAGPDYCTLAREGYSGQQLRDEFFTFLHTVKNTSDYLKDEGGNLVHRNIYKQISSEVYDGLRGPTGWPELAGKLYSYYQYLNFSSGHMKREIDLTATSIKVPMALNAITCGDWDDIPGNITDFENWLALYQKRSKFGGDQALIHILYQCSLWQVNAKEKFNGTFTNIKTKTPILFVNNPYDPVTPLISAQNASSGFVDSRVLQHIGVGHCSGADASDCVDKKVALYFDTGELPNVDEVCQPNRVPFSRKINP